MGCASSSPDKKLLFGADLRTVDKDAKNPNVPRFIVECVNIVEEGNNIRTDGIYSISGSKGKIDALVKKMDNTDTSDKYEVLKGEDIHTVTGALKLFFRKLSIELIPTSALAKIPNEMDKPEDIVKIKDEVISKLDEMRKDVLKYMIHHFKAVDKHNEDNKMTAQNLAIAFGPSLFPNLSDLNVTLSNQLLKTLIEKSEDVF